MPSTLLPESRRESQQNLVFFMMMIVAFFLLTSYFTPPPQPPKETEVAEKVDEPQDETDQPDVADSDDPADETTTVAVDEIKTVPTFTTLGSMDPASPYRTLVTLTNKGAAVSRMELNEAKYREVQDRTGYLGQIVADLNALPQDSQPGCFVQVLGKGTPAEKAGLQIGDRIVGLSFVALGKTTTAKIENFTDLRTVLLQTRPRDRVEIEVQRSKTTDENVETLKLETVLGVAPISIVRPIGTIKTYEEFHGLRGLHGYDETIHDQLSYLCTLSTIDNHRLDLPKCVEKNPAKHVDVTPRDQTVDIELSGVELRRGLWELVQSSENEAVYRKTVPKWNLEVWKTFRLAQKQEAAAPETDERSVGPFGAYHLTVDLEIKNLDSKPHTVAYMLDGPTGMPLEGAWYPRKPGPGWGIYGIRDVVVKFRHGPSETIANSTIANDKFNREPWKDDLLDYIGIDTQYFQCTLLPNGESSSDSAEDAWHSRTIPIRIGEHNMAWSCVTDATFRTYSKEKTLLAKSDLPNQTSLSHSYTIFAGPKKPDILAVYGLGNTIAYGWFWFVAIPMLVFLHFLKTYVVFHYGLAIIVLTVCVRLLMFPLSRKQAINAAKNTALMPEMQKIKEKYKGDMEAQSRAQQELWKKHKFNPLSGCLGIFIQLPIFVALYKALSIDVELYGAPLISNNFWCNDLSAPDMLFEWSGFWNWLGWTSFNTGHTPGIFGMLALGPYFNLLPIFTVALILIQQKIMMPPATDDNMRMQQKMMNYMMIFMGFVFFRMPSGLCVYFIATSLWGLAERKLVPKYEFKLDESQSVAASEKEKPHSKKAKDKRALPTEKEEVGMLGEMWRKINEKANEPRTITKKPGEQKKKKRKKGR